MIMPLLLLRSVLPSGVARATASAAMMPPPPGLLSIKISNGSKGEKLPHVRLQNVCRKAIARRSCPSRFHEWRSPRAGRKRICALVINGPGLRCEEATALRKICVAILLSLLADGESSGAIGPLHPSVVRPQAQNLSNFRSFQLGRPEPSRLPARLRDE